ncbi:MAG: MbnP family protein [Bacteroidota bacterium]
MKARSSILYLMVLLLVFLTACKKPSEPDPGIPAGKVTFKFFHYCDGQAVEFDIRKYVNEAGNEYMVNEIQYFISDVYLHRSGTSYLINGWKDIHYVDTDISSTQEWKVYDHILAGEYSGISFTFGISEEKNQTLMYTDPPESLMFWPTYLGGGYHYLKLNGKWLDTNQLERPYNFHLGIGQEYDPVSGDITGFIQNYFEVIVPESGFVVNQDQETIIHLVMNVDSWFKSPHTYDHNYWGGDIMQNQQAMIQGCENGQDVFEVLSFKF